MVIIMSECRLTYPIFTANGTSLGSESTTSTWLGDSSDPLFSCGSSIEISGLLSVVEFKLCFQPNLDYE